MPLYSRNLLKDGPHSGIEVNQEGRSDSQKRSDQYRKEIEEIPWTILSPTMTVGTGVVNRQSRWQLEGKDIQEEELLEKKKWIKCLSDKFACVENFIKGYVTWVGECGYRSQTDWVQILLLPLWSYTR